jgi:DNA-binding beta-propeller fold protein YncE
MMREFKQGCVYPVAALALAAAFSPMPAFSDDLLATGQTVSPTAAPGSRIVDLNPGLTALPGVTLGPGQDVTKFIAGQPEATAISPNGRTLLVMTSGFNGLADINANVVLPYSTEYVFVYDVSHDDPVLRHVIQVPMTFDSLAFAPDGRTFFVSGGQDDVVRTYAMGASAWAESGPPIAVKDTPTYAPGAGSQVAGVAVNSDGSRIVAANYESDSISVIDPRARTVVATLDLRPGKNDPSKSGVPGGEFPYWVAIKGKSTAYVSSLRDREIVVVDFSGAPKITARISLPGNPNRMILNRDRSRLFVTSDNSDTVDVISTEANQMIASINTTAPKALFAGALPHGSSPNSLALSPDERTLYVTNGGSNSVAVVALNEEADGGEVRGLIPTGWYPNSVSVSRNGRMLYVADGKRKEGPNTGNCRPQTSDATPAEFTPPGCQLATDQNGSANQYILQLSKGELLAIPVPDPSTLAQLTQKVASNNGFGLQLTSEEQQTLSEVATRIKHVIYIIKENRTYDQVLGDLGRGNGDPSIAQFPKALTPNFHALATSFVDLDNFYCSGDVSMDGWQWSTAARTSDGNEKAYIVNYAGRGLSYDSEGDARGSINVSRPGIAARQQVDPRIPNDPDLLPGPRNEVELDGPAGQVGAGYLWDAVLRAGKTVRDYGVFGDEIAGQPVLRDPRSTGTRVAIPSNVALEPYIDPYYRTWETCLPDFWREREWEEDFDQFVAASAKAGRDLVPNLSIMRFPQDHTGCFGSGVDHADTVEREEADNDYAVGRLVERVAHSPFAGNTMIFVLEDDAQDGPDHVDARRSTAYVVGPYVKQGAVISTQYTTVNVVRTIEDLLGLERLNLHDGGVKPMVDVMDPKQTEWNYRAVPSPILRAETQLPLPPASEEEAMLGAVRSLHTPDWWARALAGMNFSHEDLNDPAKFNRILWLGTMGDKPYPGVRHAKDPSPDAKEPAKVSSN